MTTTTPVKIDITQVYDAYSGRPGCACGCRGKHTYTSNHRAYASENRGYEVTDDEVNDKTVKLLVNKVQAFLDAGEKPGIEIDICEPNYIAVEIEDRRLYVIYLVH